MQRINRALQAGKKLRVIGFDDAPFARQAGTAVHIAGVVCSNTRFEGMLWGSVSMDGMDATETVIELIKDSKFYPQLHAILFDGIAFGGFNILDLPRLCSELAFPVIAVMRAPPDLPAITDALQKFANADDRMQLIKAAGVIYNQDGFHYQCAGIEPDLAATLLSRITDTGHVPEPLRLAHLIGAAVKTGQSSKRA